MEWTWGMEKAGAGLDMTEDEYTRDFEEEIKKMEEKRPGGVH